MESALVDQAIELLDKANAELEPELLPAAEARRLLACYARARRLVDFAIAGLSRKLDDASEVARATGTSMGQAKAVVATGQVLAESEELSAALQQGAISLDQANEIAAAEQSCPGAAHELVAVAKKEAFHVLKDKARTTKLEAERDRDLCARQRAARRTRSYADELGMVCIDLTLEPHVGTRSWLGPRPRRPAWQRQRAMEHNSRSSATSPTPTSRSSRARQRDGRAVPSSSCW